MTGDADRRRLVVVGASLAGLRAVEAARDSGFTGPITLIGAEPHLPYDRPQLSKAYLAGGADWQVNPYKSRSQLSDELGVELVLGASADGLDVTARRVSVAGGHIDYHAAVIATGAQPRTVGQANGIDGVHTLRTPEDAANIRRAMDCGARVVVIGAGFIGSEIASAARARNLPATIVDVAGAPLASLFGDEVGSMAVHLHRQAGTQLQLRRAVTGYETAGGHVTGVRLDDDTLVPADVVVCGVGVKPATAWLAGSGVTLHEDGGIICDSRLATSIPGVYAAGDVAHVPYELFDHDHSRVEHWTNAAEHGAIAARHALDPGAAEPVSTVPYFWSDWYGHRIQFVGTSRADEVRLTGRIDDGVVALYRRADRIVGAFTIDRPRDIMKFRRQIAARGSWTEAVNFAGGLTPAQ